MVLIRDIRKILCLLMFIVTSMANDIAWYQSSLSETVAPKYVNAYRTLQNKIVKPLLTYKTEELTDAETEVNKVVALAQNLTCATKELYNDVRTVLGLTEQLNTDLEIKSASIIKEVSQKEAELQQANNELANAEARLNDAQLRVTQAENDVRSKEQELSSADADLAQKERKLEESRRCGKRRKRFLKKVWRGIKKNIINPVVRTVCSVFNYEGIRSAKSRRGEAQGSVNAAREQLAVRRQELERQRSAQVQFQNKKNQATTQLQGLNTNLNQLKTSQSALANMMNEMRKAVLHLTSFASKSSVLYDELLTVVSFESLVDPLNAVLTEFINNGVKMQEIAGVNQISQAEINLISDNLKIIKSKLPSLPLNDGTVNPC